MCDTLDVALEICKQLKYSPRRDTIFQKLHQELTPQALNIRYLCPTRWTVCALSLESICVNYSALEATSDEALEVCSQSEVKARIIGVQSKMKDFDFLYGLLLGERILKHTDNLSKTLQATVISAIEAYSMAKLCMDVLRKLNK